MEVDVQNNTDSITQLANELVESLVLGTIGWLLATVRLRARIGRSTTLVGVPAKLPVTVDITTNACLVRSSCGWRLTILSPESIGSGRVDLTISGELQAGKMHLQSRQG